MSKTGKETVRANFNGTNGECPAYANLLANGANEFFGTAYEGGEYGCGTVFKLSENTGTGKWAFKVLYNFAATNDGCYPYSGLVMDKKGNLYGTTYYGNSGDYSGDGYGTVFELSPPATSGGAWTETLLYSFCQQTDCVDGYYPTSTLVMDKTGTLYGTTYYGGSEDAGTVFAIPPYGGEAVLHSFCQQSGCPDGSYPWGSVTLDKDGNIYGMTEYGGTGYWEGYDGYGEYGGTVFKVSNTGQFSTLYSFCSQGGADCTDGYDTWGALVMDKTGNLYGTAEYGGNSNCTDGCGTVFEILHETGEAVLYTFTGNDGAYPMNGLTKDAKGNLYGTTEEGGSEGYGTVFKLTP